MRDTDRVRVVTHSPEETYGLGLTLGRLAYPGLVVVLNGELGAGKTFLAQGVGRGLGVEEPIRSPTFTLIHEYHGRLPFYHLDLYRLDGSELEDLGLDEYLDAGGVTLLEWGEKANPLLACDRLVISLNTEPSSPNTRSIIMLALGSHSLAVLRELVARLKCPCREGTEEVCSGDAGHGHHQPGVHGGVE